LTPHEGEVKFLPGPWAADGSGFHLLMDEGREFMGLAFQALDSGKREWVEAPDRDIDELAGSADGRVLAWLENDEGFARVRVRDVEAGRDLPEPTLPKGTASGFGSGLSVSRDGSRLALAWDQPARPPEIYVVDAASGAARPVTESRAAGLAALRLRDPELIRYPSFDGREIPAWLYRPDGDGPAPFVVAIHGGPESAGEARVPPALPVPLEPRYRRDRDEHPRLDRLRQDVPDAHPPRLGRRRHGGLASRGRVAEGAGLRRRRAARRLTAARTAASRR